MRFTKTVAPVLFTLLHATSVFADKGMVLHHAKPVPNNYIVIFKDSVPRANAATLAHELAVTHGAAITKHQQGEAIFQSTLKGFVAEVPEQAVNALANDPRVAYIEEDAYVTVSSQRPHSAPTLRTLLRASEPAYSWPDELEVLNTRRAHRSPTLNNAGTTQGSGVTIYFMDTGVEKTHEQFFTGQVLAGVQFGDVGQCPADSPNDGNYRDEHFSSLPHGTGTASVAGGTTIGMASAVHIVPIKVMKCTGDESRLSWWVSAIDWISGANPYYRRPAVLSISMFYDAALFNSNFADAPISSFEQSLTNLINFTGMAVIVSANNQGPDYVRANELIWTSSCPNSTPCTAYKDVYPYGRSCYQSPSRLAQNSASFFGNPNYRVISVGGLDESDRIWDCNNFGGECPGDNPPHEELKDTTGSNTGSCVDIYAPAHHIATAALRGANSYRYADSNSGTSFAAPYVAAIAARILQNNPNLTPSQLWTEIKNRAIALPSNFDHDGVLSNDLKAAVYSWE